MKKQKTVILASPRGFCAGVERAVKIVEVALEKYGAPVYVRHEIVHNKRVVGDLAAKGAVFVKELDEIPEGAAVVFSAHGVARAVHDEAERREMMALDATCPLVTKVHIEADRHARMGKHILLIGHAGHPEVIGTMVRLLLRILRLSKRLRMRRLLPRLLTDSLHLRPRQPCRLMKQQK